MKFNFHKKTEKVSTERRRANSRSSADSGRIFSYYSSRPAQSQKEPMRPRNDKFDQEVQSTNNRQFRYIPSLIALVLILSSIVYASLLDTSNPEITPLSETSVNLLQNTDKYKDSIAGVFGENFLNKSKLTINTRAVEDKIKATHPEIEEVSINVPLLGRRPVVQISPATPKLLLSSGASTYVVNDRGRVLMNAEESPEDINKDLVIIKDFVIGEVKPGDIILPESTIEFIDQVKYQFESSGKAIEYITLPAVANELHVKPMDSNYIVKFNLQSDPREQSGVYFALYDRLAKEALVQPKEYVDVRVESRAYYK